MLICLICNGNFEVRKYPFRGKSSHTRLHVLDTTTEARRLHEPASAACCGDGRRGTVRD
jgi:hypothetical protein